jgi:hypothetical protein
MEREREREGEGERDGVRERKKGESVECASVTSKDICQFHFVPPPWE